MTVRKAERPMHADDLDQLRDEFPGWRFGTVWTTVATGPDVRRVWARKDDVLLSDWNAGELRAAVSAEQRRSEDEA
jgi:hypothetical protein